ncbi:hypothetical protein GCM10027456_20030 [Kineosporia babensis]|uniref:Uncharacterized protein n=1 Tax=Kineosporia babensis TaxID=499548 RepID=A0A9X1SUZ2_9ACTN|nr:hypothetical protein [Kineosporia babensis]MCD5313299.1 hypothetical protein [Kineosporia babensis]
MIGRPGTVVGHGQPKAARGIEGQPDLRMMRSAVPDHVGQCLGHHEVHHRLDGRRKPSDLGHLEVGRHRAPCSQRIQGTRKTAICQDRRVDAAQNTPQSLHRIPDLDVGLAHQTTDLVVLSPGVSLLGDPQPNRDGHQMRLRTVVQIPLDPTQFTGVGIEYVGPALGQYRHPLSQALGPAVGRRGSQLVQAAPGQPVGRGPERRTGHRQQEDDLRRPQEQSSGPTGHRDLDEQTRRVGRIEHPPQPRRHRSDRDVAHDQQDQQTRSRTGDGLDQRPARNPPAAAGRWQIPGIAEYPARALLFTPGPDLRNPRTEQQRENENGQGPAQ